MTSDAHPSAESLTRANQLLEAQVRFWLHELSPQRLAAIVREETAFLYQELDRITLAEAVSADKIKGTAHRYALEMEIGGAIPELFGEVADIIYNHPTQDTTRVSDIFSSRLAQEFLEKIFESGSQLDRAMTQIQHSAPFKGFLADVSLLVLKGYVQEKNRQYSTLPLIGSGLRRAGKLVQERRPQWQESLEQSSHSLLQRSISKTMQMLDELLDQDRYREQALAATLNLWDEISTWPVARFRDFTTENDLQELMVLGYEFWLEFRESDYLVKFIDAAVDFFFEKYGADSLQQIISEVGVTYEMIEAEILNYSDELATLATNKGIAETLIRRHLERFYFSAETLALLAEPATP